MFLEGKTAAAVKDTLVIIPEAMVAATAIVVVVLDTPCGCCYRAFFLFTF